MVVVEQGPFLRSDREIQVDTWSRFYERQYPQLTDEERLLLAGKIADIAMRDYVSQEEFDKSITAVEKGFLEQRGLIID